MQLLTSAELDRISGGQVGSEGETIPTPDSYKLFGDYLEGVAKGIWKAL
jgi:hypothetical protein